MSDTQAATQAWSWLSRDRRARAPAWRAALALAAGIALALVDRGGYRIASRLDEQAFDGQAALVRVMAPGRSAPAPDATADSVVLVGIDEASLDGLAVPLALMHATLGTALTAIADGRPRAIGLDVALPEHSFDRLLAGLDVDLMHGLVAARAAAPLAVALDADAQGRLRIPYAPLLAAAGGSAAFGLPLFPLDCDGVVRRYEPDLMRLDASTCSGGALPDAAGTPPLPTLAGRIAQQLGRSAPLARDGWLDFTRGPPFSYIPLRQVVQWQREGRPDQLRRHFGGRIVLLGSVLPYLDRLRLPVPLAGWEAAAVAPPGLVANGQLLRNALGAGLVHRPPAPAGWLLFGLLVAVALPARANLRYLLFALALALVLVMGTLLHASGWFLAPGSALLAAASALAIRTALDLAAARAERARLAQRFGGYLSPALLDALLEEDFDEAGARQGLRRPVALLFADLHDFTRRSEHGDPAQVRALLNRYYAAVTPGIHARGGLIDNFRGDGIMVMFGAPRELERPCDAALAAARELLERIAVLNRDELEPRGIAAVDASIGLAYGEVVYGELGSAERRDYTALGDAVNVAAHLQAVSRRLGRPIVMTADFTAQLVAPSAHLQALGMQEIKGHTPLALYAWSPAPS